MKELPGTLIKICTGTGFNKERAIAQVEGGSSVLVSCNNERLWWRGGEPNPIMKPNKASGRMMGQNIRGKRFEPEGLLMFHSMKEEVRRCKGGQGIKEELRAARRRGFV